MHPLIIDGAGHLYVDMGSATNACQRANRIPHSPGIQPCTELETRAGTWRYDANKTDQHFSPAERYVTGLRNGEGFCVRRARAPYRHPAWPRPALARTGPTSIRQEQGQNCRRKSWCAGASGRRFRLAGMLFRRLPAEARAGSRIWRRWRQEGRGLRAEAGADRVLPGALGAERHADRRRHAIPDGLSRRRLHRLPWLMEPRARAAGRLQRGVPAAG